MRVPRVAVTQAEEHPRRYDPPHVLWYFGAIVAALAANETVAETTSSHRGVVQLLVALGFLAGFAALAALALRAGFWVPGGVLVTAAVALVPAATLAFEHLIGVSDDPNRNIEGLGTIETTESFEGAIFAIGVVTIVAGLVAYRLVPFPFIFSTVAIAALLTAQVLVPLFVDDPGANTHANALLLTAAALVLVAVVLDTVGRPSEAFWWHVFGLLALGAGLFWYAVVRGDEWAWITILVIAGALLVLSAPFARATWATYGVLGVYAVVLHYIGKWLGAWWGPTFMTAAGVGLIVVGIALQLYQRLWARLGPRPPAEPPPPPERPTPPPPPPPPPPEPAAEPPPDEPAPDEPPRDGSAPA